MVMSSPGGGSFSILSHIQRQGIGHVRESDVDVLCAGMFFDIMQCLLRDAQQRKIYRRVEALRLTCDSHIHMDGIFNRPTRCGSFDVLNQGCVFELFGLFVPDHAAGFVEPFTGSLFRLSYMSLQAGWFTQARCGEMHDDGCEMLGKRIVYVTGESLPFGQPARVPFHFH
jgi:hypothetical protein